MGRAGSPGRTRWARVTHRGCHGTGRLPGWPTRVPGSPRPAPSFWQGPASRSPRRAAGWGGCGVSEEPQGWARFWGFLFTHARVSPLGGRFTGEEAKPQSKPWTGTGPAAGSAAAGASRRAAAPVCRQPAGGGNSPRRCPGEPRSAAQPGAGPRAGPCRAGPGPPSGRAVSELAPSALVSPKMSH